MPAVRAASFVLVLLASSASGGFADDNREAPRETDLVERAAARLAQVEISVQGAPEDVVALRPQDFKLRVHLRRIREFELDRHCPAPHEPAPAESGYGPGTFLFYFDQPHLTMAGRARAIDLAGELIDALIGDGAQAMIVSDARALRVVHEPSSDRAALRASLLELENDRAQWDFFAEQEDDRVSEVIEILNSEEDVTRAITVARSYQRQEHFRSDKSWRRLAVLVGQLAALRPPRTVLYFADTMRSNPGEHYLTFFGTRLRSSNVALSRMTSDVVMGGLSFERVLNEASAYGVSFYPVLAQGLVAPMDRNLTGSGAQSRTYAVPEPSRRRFRDVQDALSSLAEETGGHAFLRGDPAKRIVARLQDDRACLYVASFDPADLPLDRPLRVVVEALRPGIRVQTRGRIVLQSEQARVASRLLGAFSLDGTDAESDIRTTLIPDAWGKGGYRALLQVVVPPTALPAASWDVGASVVYRERVEDEVSGRVAVTRPEVAVVLEHELTLAPGLHEIVSVAHEAASDFVLSDHRRLELPEPDLRHAVVAPIVTVQPASAAFLRGDRSRTRGSLGWAEAEPLDARLPTALLSLVCRGARQQGAVSVERTLSGSTAVDFPPIEFDLGDDLCAQVRDVIPPDTLGPGSYRYELRVLKRGETVDRAELEIIVGAP